MEIRGHEIQRWVNPINEIMLQKVKEQERNIAYANDPKNIEKFLVTANTAFEEIFRILNQYNSPINWTAPYGFDDWNKFKRLYEQWQRSRKITSSIVGDITRNPFYFQIVGMGPAALPFIFSHLEDEAKSGEPDHWFAALSAITEANPVPPGDEGKIDRMARAWLEWGKREGYLYDEGMGKGLSQSW